MIKKSLCFSLMILWVINLSGQDHRITNDSIHIYLENANQFYNNKDYESSIALYNRKILPLATRNKDYHLLCYGYIKSAEIYARQRKPDVSLQILLKADSLISLFPEFREDTVYGHWLMQSGYNNLIRRNYPEAIENYHQAIELWNKYLPANAVYLAICNSNIAYAYYAPYPSRFNKAEPYYIRSLRINQSNPSIDPSRLAGSYFTIGSFYYEWKVKPDTAIDFLEKAQNLYRRLPDPASQRRYVIALNRLSELYIQKNLWQMAFSILKKSDSAISVQLDENIIPRDLSVQNQILWGDYFKGIQDYQQAAFKYNHAVTIWESIPPNDRNQRRYNYVKQALAVLYSDMGNYERAIEENRFAIQGFYESGAYRDELISTLNQLNFFSIIGRYDSLSHYLPEVEEIVVELELQQDLDIIAQMNMLKAFLWADEILMGDNDYSKSKLKKAIKQLHLAKDNYKKIYGPHYTKVAAIWLKLANIQHLSGNYNLALSWADSAMFSAILPIDKSIYHGLQNKNKIVLSYSHLIDAIALKGAILIKKFKRSPEHNEEFIHQAIRLYRQADSLMDQKSLNLAMEESRLFFRNRLHFMYENAIKTCLLAYRQLGTEVFVDEAFQYIEKNKALLLLESRKDEQAKIKGGLPDAVWSKEHTMKSELAFLQQAISKADEKDQDSLLMLIENLLGNYNQLIEMIRDNYPDYYHLKYDRKVIPLREIQSILSDRALVIDYFAGNDSLYAIAQSKDQKFIHVCALDSALDIHLIGLQNSISGTNFGENLSKSWDEYVLHASQVYNIILKPILNQFSSVYKLIIIPDGELGKIPFESLISNYPTTGTLIKPSHFLLYDYSIVYDYSATIFGGYRKEKRTNNIVAKCIGLAPSYVAHALPSITNESGLKSIEKLIDGKYLYGPDASESRFREIADQYEILHFATHGSMDTLHQFSWLALTTNSSSTEDGYLYAYELYNMKLNALMAVLGACETGVGKEEKSEGIMSLARAFAYAGCPSVIMSLWKAHERTTFDEILPEFYRGLKRGLDKAEALRQAKLTYLNNAGGKDLYPFYWAALVSTGDQTPLNLAEPRGNWPWWALGSTLVLLLLLAGIKRFVINKEH